MCKRHVSHDPAPKERVLDVSLRPINKLIHQHDVTRVVFPLERADGADADNPRDADFLHCPNVGAVVQLAGQNAVAPPVAWKEDNLAAREFSAEQGIRRRAKRRADSGPFLVGEAFDVVKPAAANDADAMF